MILQLRSDALAALLAEEGGHCRQAKMIKDAVMQARQTAKLPPIPETICNDRTSLSYHALK